MNKNFILLFFLFLIQGCSYEPILSSKNYDFSFSNITSDGDVSINQTIIKDLNKKSVGNKKYNISFFSKKNKDVVSSNENGDPSIYQIEIYVDFTIEKDGIKIITDNVIRQSTYNNINDKFELDKYEENIIKNLSENISSEILMIVSTLNWMIIKSFEFNNSILKKYNFYLFYGINSGFQDEIIETYFTNGFNGEITKYEEAEFLKNIDLIIGEINTKSLFSTKRIVIISRTTDKVSKYLNDISEKLSSDVIIILKSGLLEKRSKLRSIFEKSKYLVTVPFYEDNDKSLEIIANKYFREHKIKISREAVNLIIKRSSGDRKNLKTELTKILNFSFSNKNILFEHVEKLSNLNQNYAVTDLANSYLSKNSRNIARILNENNYTEEDCILILRTLLNKSKRLLDIIQKYQKINNLDQVISTIKPPIFWKEKEIIKIQVNLWKSDELKKKIYKINDVEGLIKLNSANSLNVVSDFIVNY